MTNTSSIRALQFIFCIGITFFIIALNFKYFETIDHLNKGIKDVNTWAKPYSNPAQKVNNPIDSMYVLHPKQLQLPNACTKPIVAVTVLTEQNLKSIESFGMDINSRHIPLIITATDDSTLKITERLRLKTVIVDCWMEINFEKLNFLNYFILTPSSIHKCNQASKGVADVRNVAYAFAMLLGGCSIWEFDATSSMIGPEYKRFFSEGQFSNSTLSEFTIFSHETIVANSLGLFNPKHRTYLPSAKHDVKMQSRGLPHTDISKSVMPTLYATDMLNLAARINHTFKIGIIQSLQDDFPDFNPEYNNANLPKLFFKPTIPHVNIHPSQFMPVNDKATLFRGGSLWALFRPPSIPSRMSDIWRGYIAQAIMRCTGQLVSTLKPVVVANMRGNEDQQLTDMDKTRLTILIEALTSFQCISSSASTIKVSECFSQLYNSLMQKKLITETDQKQASRWIQLLTTINYTFPLVDSKLCNTKSKGNMFLVQAPQHPEKALKDVKFRNKKLPEYSQMLLVVQVNHGKLDGIPVWLAIYQYLVPATVRFYSPALKECFTFATPFLECNFTTLDTGGNFQYESVAHAMQNYPNFEMYFHVHDDLIFNPLGYESLIRSQQGAVANPKHRYWFCVGPGGKDVFPKTGRGINGNLGVPVRRMNEANVLIPLISNFSRYCPATNRSKFNYTSPSKYGPQETCLFGVAPEYDSFSVPKRFKNEWLEISKIGRKHKIYCEILIPFLQICVMGSGTKPTTTIELTRTRREVSKEQIENTKFCQDMRKDAAELKKLGTKKIYPQGLDLRSGHPFKLSVHATKALAGRNCFLEPFY